MFRNHFARSRVFACAQDKHAGTFATLRLKASHSPAVSPVRLRLPRWANWAGVHRDTDQSSPPESALRHISLPMNCANSFGLISPKPLNRVISGLPAHAFPSASEQRNGVLPRESVGRSERQTMGPRLANQHPVKGIAMQWRQQEPHLPSNVRSTSSGKGALKSSGTVN